MRGAPARSTTTRAQRNSSLGSASTGSGNLPIVSRGFSRVPRQSRQPSEWLRRQVQPAPHFLILSRPSRLGQRMAVSPPTGSDRRSRGPLVLDGYIGWFTCPLLVEVGLARCALARPFSNQPICSVTKGTNPRTKAASFVRNRAYFWQVHGRRMTRSTSFPEESIMKACVVSQLSPQSTHL